MFQPLDPAFDCRQTVEAEVPDEVPLALVLGIGRSVVIPEEGLSIGFESVLEDSRCPLGAVCIWEGNARIVVRIGKWGDRDTTAQLSTFLAPREAVYLNYMVRLLALEPVPVEGVPTDTARYKVTLVVRRIQK